MSDGATPKRRGPKPGFKRQSRAPVDGVEVVLPVGSEVHEPGVRGSVGGNGDPGKQVAPASKSSAAVGLPRHERHGLIEEALYTHEMQIEHVRLDSRNRRWTFRPENRNCVASLLIHLKRGPDERETLIDNAKFGADNVRDDVEAAIDLLDEALA